MKHIHSSCLRHPSETYTHTHTKSEKKSVREILVYLPGGFVLSGFNKNTEIPEKNPNFVDRCFQGAIKQPPAAACYSVEMPYLSFHWGKSLLSKKIQVKVQQRKESPTLIAYLSLWL